MAAAEEIGSYVPSTARHRPWAVGCLVLSIAGAVAARAAHAPYAPLLVVLAIVVLLLLGPAIALSRTRLVVLLDGAHRSVQVDTHRFLAPTRRVVVRFETSKPKVTLSEWSSTTLTIGDGTNGIALDDIPAAAVGALRARLGTELGRLAATTAHAGDAVLAPDLHAVRDETRALVVAILHHDHELAMKSLARGAAPDGHPDACGRGAPLFAARVLKAADIERLLRARGATADVVEPPALRMLVLLAATSGVAHAAELFERHYGES